MARQLALLALRRLEVPIVLRDLTQEQVDEAVAWIAGELDELTRKGRIGEGKARFLGSLVSGGTGWEVFAGSDLVLEAVFEEMSVKKEVFAELERVVSAECLLATNTSSLSVTEMGADLEHPERVVGMHFFNPVAVLPLVELVRTPLTDDVTLATAWDVTAKLRKRGVLVRDAPAFVVNRVLSRTTTVLMDALEHGNTVDETDEAVLRLGLPMAPSVLLQMVGPRVANHVLHTLHEAYPDRYPALGDAGQLRGGLGGDRRPRTRAEDDRGDPRRRAGGHGGRSAAHPRRRCRTGGRRRGHLPHSRRRLSLLARRHHQAPRPDGDLAARDRPAACRSRRDDRYRSVRRNLRYALTVPLAG